MKSGIGILLIFLLTFGCSTEKETTKSDLNYIPENAAIIIKINDLSTFKKELSENTLLTTISATNIYKDIFDKTKHLKYLKSGTSGILTFSELNKDNFEFIFIGKKDQIAFDLDSIPNKKVEHITSKNREFDKYDIDNSVFYSIILDDKIILSSSQVLLENMIKDSDRKTENPNLKRLFETANTTRTASIFSNLENSNALVSAILNETSKITTHEFSDWVSVDFSSNKDQLKLNGLTIANDSTKNYINLFRNTNPLSNQIASFAPINTDAILSYTFDDYSVFSKNQQAYLGRSTPMDSLFNTVEEIGFIYLNNQKAIVLNTYGSEEIATYLTSIKKKAHSYRGNEITELNSVDFFKNTLYPITQDFNPNFYTILENAFIFSKSKDPLHTIINHYKNGDTFDQSTIYSNAKNGLASESSVLFISNSKGLENILKDECVENFYKDFKKSNTSKFAFGLQLVSDEAFFHSNIIVQKIEKEKRTRNVSPLLNIQLENELVTTPQFVLNHLTKKKEIVVQDSRNILYLISTDGQILWKKQLEGSIQGKIEQVDILKNGRLQLAFTTNNQFLILDRNGKEVKPFTFAYEGGNLNPLAVFDYEGKKEYRFLVTQGQKIFMYNNNGDIVKGFKYTSAKKPILGKPKHFRIGKKDYLVFKLEDGSLKILNRIGKDRINVKEKIDFSENDVYNYKNKFTVTDKKGTLYQVDQSSKIAKTNFNLAADHGIDATKNTLVYMNDNVLSIKGRKIELELGVYTTPKIFYLYDKIYVGVTDIQNQKVYLYDSQAKAIPNFPVYGTSIIDIADMNNNRRLELITKDQENSLIIYQF